MNAELKEKIAKEIGECIHGRAEHVSPFTLLAAFAALSAIEAAGYVVVPREPTLVMLDVAMAIVPRDDAKTVWEAMIEAVEQAQ